MSQICTFDVFRFLMILNNGPILNFEKVLFDKNCFFNKLSMCFRRDVDDDGIIQDNNRNTVKSELLSASDSHLDVTKCISSNN